jgi:para-nitrobenzyl esterase
MSASFMHPVVETSSGQVRGIQVGGVSVFKGIPYGASTAGDKRFTAPLPVPAWTGVRSADAFGDRAPQWDRPYPAGFDWLFSTRNWSEDCLCLNVYSGGLAGRHRPVLVWLHGGAFAFGSADVPVLEASRLADFGDAVVVTVNHRLNAFGFLPYSGTDERFKDAGNAGMLDIVLALRWIRENIANFGGDPRCVTLFGQSGGGAKVAILMAMQAAKGLFHRAIVQSPSSGFRVQTMEQAVPFAYALAARLGVQADDFASLQKIPAPQFLETVRAVVQSRGGADRFRPLVDERNLLGDPFFPDAPAVSREVPMIVGNTATEATFYLAADPASRSLPAPEVRARITRFLETDDPSAMHLLEQYQANHPEARPADLLVHIASDYMYRLSAIEGAEQKALQHAAPVYVYEFARHSQAFGGYLRAPHTAEIPFVFGNVEMARAVIGPGEAPQELSRTLMRAWLHFARTGSPNGQGVPRWPEYDVDQRMTMVFDEPFSRVIGDPRGGDRRLIAAFPRFSPGAALNFREPASAGAVTQLSTK